MLLEFPFLNGIEVRSSLHELELHFSGEPKIDIQRIKDVRMFVPPEISLVLHAGSGIPDEDIKSAISGGIANIHINTDIRVAFTNALRTAIAENPDETTPYKLVKGAMDAVQATVENKVSLFGGENRVYY
mgnify:CR=1 FL=1